MDTKTLLELSISSYDATRAVLAESQLTYLEWRVLLAAGDGATIAEIAHTVPRSASQLTVIAQRLCVRGYLDARQVGRVTVYYAHARIKPVLTRPASVLRQIVADAIAERAPRPRQPRRVRSA